MSSPQKKRVIKTKDGRSDLHNMIDIVVRAIITEKGYQTKKQVDIAIAKSLIELKSLESRVQSMETALSMIKTNAEESQSRLLEKLLLLEKEISAGETQKKWAVHLNKAIKKHREDMDASNKKLGEDISSLNQRVASTQGLVDEMYVYSTLSH